MRGDKHQKWDSMETLNSFVTDSSVDPYERFADVVNENCGSSIDTAICFTNLELVPEEGSLVLKASPATLGATTVLLDG